MSTDTLLPTTVRIPDSQDGRWIYIHLDAEAQPLYVGQTTGPRTRMDQHRYDSPWYPQVADVVWYGPFPLMDIPNVDSIERELIVALQPPHNRTHVNRRRTPLTPTGAVSLPGSGGAPHTQQAEHA